MGAKDQKQYLLYFTLILIFLTSYLFFLDFSNLQKEGKLTLAVLDVGQGDAIFVESPTGMQILIDAGGGERIVSNLTKIMSPFDRSIDVAIITNPDRDHIGGFESIIANYEIGILFEPGTYNDSTTYENISSQVARQKIPHFLARQGTILYLGDGSYLEILFPDRDVKDFNTNDGSVVARLVYGKSSILLMGDATFKSEKIILSDYDQNFLDSDILKVGHHGSKTSSSLDFIKTVSPKYALISLGQGNKYGHPHSEVLKILEGIDAEILRTDELGTIVFTCDKIGECKTKR